MSLGASGNADQEAAGSSLTEQLQLEQLDGQSVELGQRASQLQQDSLETLGGEQAQLPAAMRKRSRLPDPRVCRDEKRQEH